MSSSQVIRGSCHCGNIRFSFARRTKDALLGVRACGCSFCQKHGCVWTSDPSGSLRLFVSEPEYLHKYRFGTKTADFYVCAMCGVVPAVLSQIGESVYAVVNVNAFEEVRGLEMTESPADFSGEEPEGRLDRRSKTWIPNVQLD